MDLVTPEFEKRKLFRINRYLRNLIADQHLLTIVGCLFIAIVSVYDSYLVTIESQILQMEKNPICAALIRLDPEGFSYFIIGKTAGTLAVVGALLFFHRIKYSHALLVTNGVVAFQAMLLIYLHLSDPRIGGLPNFALLFQA